MSNLNPSAQPRKRRGICYLLGGLVIVLALGLACCKRGAKGEGEVYEYLEEMPDFPGGQAVMRVWINDNLRRPTPDAKGKVLVSFIVEPDGSLTGAEVKRSVDPSYDAEALRLVGTMPKWTPGKKDGRPVRCRFTIPVDFGPYAEEDDVYDYVDEIPLFPGGQQALLAWLDEHLRYPEEAKEELIQGRVLVSFIVEPDGTITGGEVTGSVDPLLDAEALRLVESMPKWTPGKQGGTAVRCRFVMPITFRL